MTNKNETTEAETVETVKPRIEDIMNRSTGFEEISVSVAFGKDLFALEGFPMFRAVAFLQEKRSGKNDADAYGTVMLEASEDLIKRFNTTPRSEEGKA